MPEPTLTEKLKWNTPWLLRYPATRLNALMESTVFEKKHFLITIADHFEPGWSENGVLDHKTQLLRLGKYREIARSTARSVADVDGAKFGHTNFYPAEQYHPEILEILSEMQAEGLGEVEVHLHHGVDAPDTSENLRRQLVTFRDTLAEKHKCLSRERGDETPRYAFVHGNLALANSCDGQFCGVDNEMAILSETGCYADMTLPSAPDRSQVAVTNRIYTCGRPMDKAVPHRSGKRLGTNGKDTVLPLIMTGPLVFNWTRRISGLPVPRIDDGALSANQTLDMRRFRRWSSANITVAGKSNWIFIKLYCHGFFDQDQPYSIGEQAKRFFGELVNSGEKTGKYAVHFVSAREAFNIAMAANDGLGGTPNDHRNHILTPIMAQPSN